MVGVLVKDEDGCATIRLHTRGGVHNLEAIDFMIVNTCDINRASVCPNDLGIITLDSSVGSPIDKRTASVIEIVDIADNNVN